jgi:hypothetical protein
VEIIKVLGCFVIGFFAGMTTMRLIYCAGLKKLCEEDQELKNAMKKYDKGE